MERFRDDWSEFCKWVVTNYSRMFASEEGKVSELILIMAAHHYGVGLDKDEKDLWAGTIVFPVATKTSSPRIQTSVRCRPVPIGRDNQGDNCNGVVS